MTPERGAAEAEAVIQRAERFVNVDDVWHEDPRSLVAALLSELRDLRERCSVQEGKIMRLEGESVERWKRAESAELELQRERKTFSQSCESAWREAEAAERDVAALRAQLAAAQAREQALREALGTLRREVSGTISGAFREELRQVIGNTNLAVLELRVREAYAAESVVAVLKEGQ